MGLWENAPLFREITQKAMEKFMLKVRLVKQLIYIQYNYSGDYRDSVDLIGRGLRHILL